MQYCIEMFPMRACHGLKHFSIQTSSTIGLERLHVITPCTGDKMASAAISHLTRSLRKCSFQPRNVSYKIFFIKMVVVRA